MQPHGGALQNGGPGRPKGIKNWRTTIRNVLDALPEGMISEADLKKLGLEEKHKLHLRDIIVIAQVKAALGGDTKAAAFLADREDGKPTQELQHTGSEGGPIEFKWPDSNLTA